ncbi:uncharacterized protein LODBEIA_P06390 [Lodderomyces beijingensis]|uniref:RNase III domain-containing protein n=1 Tax=Lodderomyces beijingensis TaxID=1775926 RepID=A0ABP0ZE15_9ASCO
MSTRDKTLIQTVDELAQLRASVSQFQATFKSIIQHAPRFDEYKKLLDVAGGDGGSTTTTEANNANANAGTGTKADAVGKTGEMKVVVDKLRDLVYTPQIKVAIRLKVLYEANRLVVLKRLANIKFKTGNGSSSSSGGGGGGGSGSDSDNALEQFLQVVPSDTDNAETSNGGETAEAHEEESKAAAAAAAALHSYPPTLPPIRDQSLLIRITTDKSYRQISDFVESTSSKFNNSHNGKLAMQGRTLMEWILFGILSKQFPSMYEEDLIVIRSRLMSRAVLARFAFGYNLVDSMKYQLSVDADIEDKMELVGKIFLSYIAGLEIEGYKLDSLRAWLQHLYQPMISDVMKTDDPARKMGMIELESLFKSATNLNQLPRKDVNFKVIHTKSDPFVAEIMLNDQLLAIGSSVATFEEAQDRAAMEIINDPQKIKMVFKMMTESYVGSINKRHFEVAFPTNPTQPHSGSAHSHGEETAVASQKEFANSAAGQPPPPPPPPPPPQQPQQPQQQSHEPSHEPSREPPHEPSFHYQSQSQFQPQPGFNFSNGGVPYVPFPYQQQQLPQQSQQQPPQPQQSQSPQNTQAANVMPQTNGIPQYTSYQPRYPDMNRAQAPDQFSKYAPQPPFGLQQAINPAEALVPTIPLAHKDINMSAKNTLYAILGPRMLQAEYSLKQIGMEFHTTCSVNGVDLGYGIDSTKQKSAQKAAMAALSNTAGLSRFVK